MKQVLSRLKQIVGPHAVLMDAESLAFFGGDILGQGDTDGAVIKPADGDQLTAVVRVLYEAGIPLTLRGGGASYTRSHVPVIENTVIIDTLGLDRILDIDDQNLTVTVEPGVTWKALDDALKLRGLRCPFWGTYSGLKATVGGSLSQNAVSLGSGVYGASPDSVIAMEVIIRGGEILKTGGKTPFHRAHGPDLTGVFCGDCGALGVKKSVTLKLIKRPTHVAGASFGFETFEAFSSAMMEIAARGLAAENLAIDPVIQRGQLGALTTSDMLSALGAIVRTAPGPFSAVKALIKAGLGARAFLKADCYAAHFLCEGHSNAEVRGKLSTIRNLCVTETGSEMSNALPLAIHDSPFRTFRPILGFEGQRWLPVHGIFSFGRVDAFHKALNALYEELGADMERHGVFMSHMFLTIGANAFVYEPVFYWPDSQHAVHKGLMDEADRLPLPTYPDAPETRAFVDSMKHRLIAIMQANGSAHNQIGKTYPFFSRRDEIFQNTLLDLKHQLDPKGLFNPGVLELPIEVDTPKA